MCWPTFTAEDNVLVGGADVRIEVQTVSFVQLAGQTPAWEQTHRLHTEERRSHEESTTV